MSVCVQVAFTAQMKDCDPDGFKYWKKRFADLAKVTKAKGVTGYKEPVDGEYWWAQLVPSDGVAYLQRAAWCLWRNKPLPKPGTIDDGILRNMAEYLADWYGSTNKKGQSFEHLCFHPADRGFWIPVDFENVLLVEQKYEGCLGSSVRLLKELESLAEALSLDLTLDHDDKKIWAARDNPGKGKAKWQKYGIESFNCLRMYRACQKSIELGAAICFS
jgi:hypothetical protein